MDFLNLHPFMRSTAHDKALGTIIGAALGDTIGLYTEFLPRTECHHFYATAKFSLLGHGRTPFRPDSHRDKFEPGEWTDDTDQSLILVLSYLYHNSGSGDEVLDAKDVAIRINSWISQGLRCLDRPPLGIGQTIGRVVMDAKYLTDPEGVALKVWLQSNRNAAPNGSLMRTHPLGVMCVGRSLEETFQTATDVGRVTHVDPRCVVACCLVTGLVRGVLRGEVVGEKDVDELIEGAYTWVDGREELRCPELGAGMEGAGEKTESRLNIEEYRRYCHAQSLRELELDDSQKMGYVYKCLGSAILTLRLAMRQGSELDSMTDNTFERLITDLIMEGGDADTNACVTGALLGAWLGYSRLPPDWKTGIKNGTWLLQKAQKLSLRVGVLAPSPPSSEIFELDPDTALYGGRGLLNREQLERRERDFVIMILEKQKRRREDEEAQERAKRGGGFGKWFH